MVKSIPDCHCGKTYESVLREDAVDSHFCCELNWNDGSGNICGELLDNHPSSAGNIFYYYHFTINHYYFLL